MLGAHSDAMRQHVLASLPTTSSLTDGFAADAISAPCHESSQSRANVHTHTCKGICKRTT